MSEQVEAKEAEEPKVPGVNAPSNKQSELTVEEASKNKVSVEDSAELMKQIAEMDLQHITWRDYCLNLLNTSSEPARTGWREKLVTSIIHWSYGKGGSFVEGNLEGLETLTELPSDMTEHVVDDSYERGGWYYNGRLPGSKKRKVLLGHYSQESLAKEGHLMWNWMFDHWNEDWDGKPVNSYIRDSKHLRKIFEFAQKSGGEVLYPDEILTYVLEKDAHEERPAFWTDVSDDIFTNGIPSQKYADDYKTKMPKIYPAETYYKDENWKDKKEWWKAYIKSENRDDPEALKALFDNVNKLADKYYKEDLGMSPCWKRMVVVILQNDISAKYAGFGPTSATQLKRAEAMAAFSKDDKTKNKAAQDLERLRNKAEKEKAEADQFK